MAKQTFTTGQVLTAAQMTSLQQTAMLGGAASAKTASYTLVAADAGTAISMSNASATTITVNTALFAAGDTVQITNLGAGVCTITAGTATVNSSASLALAQYESGTLDFTSTSAAIFIKGAAAGGGTFANLTLLNAGGTNLTGASTITVNVSSYDVYVIYTSFPNSSATAASTLGFRFNGDSGANYAYLGLGNSGTAVDGVVQYTDTAMNVATMGSSAADGFYGFLNVLGGKGTGAKAVNFAGFAQGTNNTAYVGNGIYFGSAAITSISAISSAGNFDQSGKLFIYGG